MYSILIESSTKKSLISINKGNFPLSFKHISFQENFIYQIKKLLRSEKLSIKDISYISSGTGPGSFTGIRQAAAIAKGIAYGVNIPIVGFCSLKSFLPDNDGRFISIIDAKSKSFYMLQGEKKGNLIIYNSSPKLIPQNKIDDYKTQIVSPDDVLIKNYQKKLPNEKHLAFLTNEKFKNQKFCLPDELKLHIDLKPIEI